MTSTPFLSIVIPAHNEAHRLPHSLEHIFTFLDAQPYPAEVWVVENGSQDDTLAVVQAHARREPRLRVLHTEARGKGLATRLGMLHARGQVRFQCDADLSMPIAELPRFLALLEQGADIVIGSREAPGAARYHEPIYRHWMGRIFNLLVRLTALPGIQDSQCGFKAFRGEVAEDLFRVQQLDGMSFDVEVLYIARMRGYRIRELGIPWYFDPDSRVRLVQDSLRMGLDVLTIRRNARRGVYAQPARAEV